MKNRAYTLAGAVSVLLILMAGVATAQEPATTITLQVEGGPNEGSYTVTSIDPTCSHGYAGAGEWGNQYSIADAAPEQFSSLQLIVDSQAASAEGGTGEFLATFSFGPLFTPAETSYTLRTTGNDITGEGIVQLIDRGESATVRITGATADGVGFDATIECFVVMRMEWDEDESDSETGGTAELTIGGETIVFDASTEEASCSEGLAADNDFQYNYYPLEYESAQVIGLEIYLADSSVGERFYVSLVLKDGDYTLDTLDSGNGGEGVVSISADGDRRIVEVSATTAEGEDLRIRVECGIV